MPGELPRFRCGVMSSLHRSILTLFRLAARRLVLLCVCAVTAGAQETNAPLTLDQAIEIALSRSPEALEAGWRQAEAAAQADFARSGRWPILKARAAGDSYTENQRLAQATATGDEGVFGSEVLAGELAFSLPVYTGGRVASGIQAADLVRQAAAGQLTRTREAVVFNVTSLFYGMLAQREVIRSVESAARAMEEQSRVIAEQVAAQKAARVDFLRAEVRLATLRENDTRERNSLNIQQRAFAAALGWEDPAPPVAVGELPDPRTVIAPDPADALALALAKRADYAAARQLAAAYEHALAAARSGYRPTVALQAAYGERWMPDPSEPQTGADKEHGAGRIGIVAEWNLFEGGATRARVREQAAKLGAARERVRKLKLQVRYEVETALADFESARERVATTGKAVEQARETFRIIQEKYDLGKGAMTDVLDAQAALVQTETSAARALADLVLAKASCQLAMGESALK